MNTKSYTDSMRNNIGAGMSSEPIPSDHTLSGEASKASRRIPQAKDPKLSPRRSPFKWKARVTSPSSRMPHRRGMISPGYLIDDETLDVLTNNVKDVNAAKAHMQRESLTSLNKREVRMKKVPNAVTNEELDIETNISSANAQVRRGESKLPSSKMKITFGAVREEPSVPREANYRAPGSKIQRNLISGACDFCSEPLQSLLVNGAVSEKLVELQCGHICHEECYKIGTVFAPIKESAAEELGDEQSVEGDMSKFASLPICSCGRRAIPLNDAIADEFIAQGLLTATALGKQTDKDVSVVSKPSIDSNHSFTTTGENRGFVPSHRKRASRGSSVSAMSSIISSASRSPTPSPTSAIHPYATGATPFNNSQFTSTRVPLALARSRIISGLLGYCRSQGCSLSGISDSFIDSLGLLRLADKLSVSYKSGGIPKSHNCYLFSYAFLLIDEENISHQLIFLVETDNNRFSGTRRKVSAERHGSSTVELIVGDADSIHISTKNVAILERWYTALTNPEFVFTNESMNSTQILGNAVAKLSPAVVVLPRSIDRPAALELHNNQQRLSTIPQIQPRFVIAILNQHHFAPYATNVLKNIIRALFFIKIDVLVVLASSDFIDNETQCTSQKFFSFNEIEDYDMWWDTSALDSQNNKTIGSLSEIITAALEASKHNPKYISAAVLSTFPIGNIMLRTNNNSFIEIGIAHYRSKPTALNVSTVSSWDEVMERLCSDLGLDFDNLYSSEAERDTDTASIRTKNSMANFQDNVSTASTATESDSDAEFITEAIADYARQEDDEGDILRTPQNQATAVFAAENDKTIIDTMDVSSLTPKIPLESARNSERAIPGTSPRWSSLISDIDRALDESRLG